MGGAVADVRSKEELDGVLGGGGSVVLHFWASWCEASKQMDQVFSHLSADFPSARFLRVEAEEQPEISECYSVSAVPFFVFCKDGKVVDKLEGANPPSLAEKISKVVGPKNRGEPGGGEDGAPPSEGPASHHPSDSLKNRLQQLVDSHPVFLFMKGTPDQPKCGFSRKVVDILKDEGVDFGSFDILTDNDVREGIKKFSNWPTFPQLFCKGELLGGCDIAVAMHESGELKEAFRDHGLLGVDSGAAAAATTVVSESENPPQMVTEEKSVETTSDASGALNSRLEELTNRSSVMLFMKGTPDEPRCGFSRKAVEILRQEKVEFQSFDILSDNEVRQGLKVFSNWSSYPQLYIKGELIGGSDIMLEMQRSGELKTTLTEKGVLPGEQTLEERLRDLVSSSPVMLFMKGSPDAPRCGFSSKVVSALREEGVDFGYFDILTDDEVRQGLKTFSNWPTFPQLYYKSDLIGGCDIVLELHKNGELRATLTE
ncbi:unnamed protein product [Spirodela intermedia]|uniref:Thioredoxin domain-containing protein n=1 Tax=Spirodela intermedia TaxID=51605 RepID=A0A7I8KPS9_SPIIN|nr:unnamed protein product [Spirodela intermedia]